MLCLDRRGDLRSRAGPQSEGGLPEGVGTCALELTSAARRAADEPRSKATTSQPHTSPLHSRSKKRFIGG